MFKNLANKTHNPVDIKNFKKHQKSIMLKNKTIKRSSTISFNPKADSRPFWDKWKYCFPNKDNWNGASHVLLVEI